MSLRRSPIPPRVCSHLVPLSTSSTAVLATSTSPVAAATTIVPAAVPAPSAASTPIDACTAVSHAVANLFLRNEELIQLAQASPCRARRHDSTQLEDFARPSLKLWNFVSKSLMFSLTTSSLGGNNTVVTESCAEIHGTDRVKQPCPGFLPWFNELYSLPTGHMHREFVELPPPVGIAFPYWHMQKASLRTGIGQICSSDTM